jgi:hypothetical protein
LISQFLALLLFITTNLAFAQTEGNTEVVPPGAENQGVAKLPEGVILIPGALPSASDPSTPVPESGGIVDGVYTNSYFGISFAFGSDWFQKHEGPPPSESGSYVLAQLRPSEAFKGSAKGTILIAAQDLFFSLVPAADAMQLVTYTKNSLQPEFKVERQPSEVTIANHSFVRFDSVAPVPELHRYIVATEIRCVMGEFVLTSRDTALLDALLQGLNKMKLPAASGVSSGTGGGDVPVCVKDYATKANVISRVDPVLTDRKFNPIPVRIIIGKTGEVKHVHVLNAFPEQAKAIAEALQQWRFQPYVHNGEAVEVETGIMFGTPQSRRGLATTAKAPVVN